jgi:hypothetical protein
VVTLNARLASNYSGGDLFSQEVAPQVSSARTAFTTVFGMGTGGTPSLKPPENGVSPTKGRAKIGWVGAEGEGGALQPGLALRLPFSDNGYSGNWCRRFFFLSSSCFSYGISLFLVADCVSPRAPNPHSQRLR